MNNQIASAQTEHKHTLADWQIRCEHPAHKGQIPKPLGWHDCEIDTPQGTMRLVQPFNWGPHQAYENLKLIAQAPALLAQRDALLAACELALAGLDKLAAITGHESDRLNANQFRAAITLAQKGPL